MTIRMTPRDRLNRLYSRKVRRYITWGYLVLLVGVLQISVHRFEVFLGALGMLIWVILEDALYPRA